jgi:molybdopterin-containing oxidoreductase family iron-sulfur binding subunit
MHFIPKSQQWIQVFKMESPSGGSFFMPAPCNQCENAPCVNVCPVAATYHTPEGIVLIDEHRCIGCRMCLAACPYQRRFFNWGEPELPPEAKNIPYTPEFPVGGIKGTAAKCTFCVHLLRQDKAPACVTGCPMKAVYMGDLTDDVASNGRDVVQLSRFLGENDAFRFKEELGTQPRTFYLPGHGQEFQRHANDPRTLKTPVWTWGGEGFDKEIGLWPWGSK